MTIKHSPVKNILFILISLWFGVFSALAAVDYLTSSNPYKDTSFFVLSLLVAAFFSSTFLGAVPGPAACCSPSLGAVAVPVLPVAPSAVGNPVVARSDFPRLPGEVPDDPAGFAPVPEK